MTGHRYDIQGLRAIAVLLVVLDHAGVGFLKGGYVGVDVFFVLSGFLITGVLLAGVEKRGYLSFVDFYVRRAKRILPRGHAHPGRHDDCRVLPPQLRTREAGRLGQRVGVAVLRERWLRGSGDRLLCAGATPVPDSALLVPVRSRSSSTSCGRRCLPWRCSGLRLERGRAHAVPRRDAPVITSRALRRLFVTVVVAAAASLVWSIHYTGVDPAAAYFSTFARLWELALGAALAIGSVRVSRLPLAPRVVVGWLGLGAIAAAGVMYSSATAFPGYAALLPTVGTALVIAAGIGPENPRLRASRLLSTPVLRYVGDRSYALYLWHWPVLVIAAQYVGHELSVSGINLTARPGCFLPVCCLVQAGRESDQARALEAASGCDPHPGIGRHGCGCRGPHAVRDRREDPPCPRDRRRRQNAGRQEAAGGSRCPPKPVASGGCVRRQGGTTGSQDSARAYSPGRQASRR